MHGKTTAETVKVKIAEAENAAANCDELTHEQKEKIAKRLSAGFTAVTLAVRENGRRPCSD